MGYNSHWEGSLTTSKKIPRELVEIINGMDLDVRVVTGTPEDTDSDGDAGDIVPACRDMPGSNLSADVCRVQKILAENKTGITVSGEITRAGDAANDFEKIEAVRGRVYVRVGEIRYGPRTRVSLDRWSVRVKRQYRRWPGKWKTCGWVTMTGCTTGVMWSQSDTAPRAAARFESENDALSAANAHTDRTHMCEVVRTEAL